MKHSVSILRCIVLTGLSTSCRPHLEGDWNATQMFIEVDGEVQSSKEIPYEECYPAIDPETGEVDEADITCVDRGYSITMTDKWTSDFEAENSETEGQIISLTVRNVSSGEYTFSNDSDFVFNCILDDIELNCDFTSTAGYLRDYNVIFEQVSEE